MADLYVPHASFGDLRDWLDAAWRLYYAERVVELQTAYGQSVTVGQPLDVLAPIVCKRRNLPVGSRVWVTVEPPVAQIVADGFGGYLAKLAIDDHRLQSQPRAQDWLAAGSIASLPDAGVLDGQDGAITPNDSGTPSLIDPTRGIALNLHDNGTINRRSKRARLLLGLRANSTQVAVDRRAYAFHLNSAATRDALPLRWRNILTTLEAV